MTCRSPRWVRQRLIVTDSNLVGYEGAEIGEKVPYDEATEYYICSCDRTFNTEREALDHLDRVGEIDLDEIDREGRR